MANDKENKFPHNAGAHSLTRRELNKLIGTFGITAAFGALTSYSGKSYSAENKVEIAKNAEKIKETEDKKHKFSKAKIVMGISGHTENSNKVMPTGVFDFKHDLETRTDGAVTVELYGGNSICTELTCVQKTLSGTINAFCSSTENAAQTIPFLSALDFPYLWPSMASQYYFLYSKKSNELFRDIMRKKFDLETLFSLNELRSIFLGKKWHDSPHVTDPKQVKGAKIRVTGSPLGTLALKQFGVNPIPLGWSETLQGLRSGLIDGLEASSLSASAFGMAKYISHDVRVAFFPIFEMTSINRSFFARLPDSTQEAILESAFHVQSSIQKKGMHSLTSIVGALSSPPPKGTIYSKNNVIVDKLTPDEKKQWIALASVKENPKPYDNWKRKVSRLAGGKDIYGGLYELAREIPVSTSAYDVKPHRWWT